MGINIPDRDADGTPLSRQKIAKTGSNFQLHCVEFETSKLSSVVSDDFDGTSLGYTTIKFYEDISGTETVMTSPTQTDLDSDCIRTDLLFEPSHDYEVISGFFKVLTSPTVDLRMFVRGVPDLTKAQGGSKDFILGGLNLRYFAAKELFSLDGKTPKSLPYDATYHTNKFQVVYRHPAGYKLQNIINVWDICRMRKVTGYFLLFLIVAIAGYDVYAYIQGGTAATISHVIMSWSYEHPAFVFAIGFVCGHLFWRIKDVKKKDIEKA